MISAWAVSFRMADERIKAKLRHESGHSRLFEPDGVERDELGLATHQDVAESYSDEG